MFVGFVVLNASLGMDFLVTDESDTPVELDDLPGYRVYGPDGLMSGGTGTATEGDTTGLYHAEIAALASNGYAAGQTYFVLIQGTISDTDWAKLFSFSCG